MDETILEACDRDAIDEDILDGIIDFWGKDTLNQWHYMPIKED